MLHRRSTATAVVAMLLLPAAALTSCADEAHPTDRINTIGAGTNDRDGSVDVLGARVVAYADGEGRLIGTFVYNDNDAEEPATLDEVTGDGITVAGGQATGVKIAPGGHVNLAAEDAPPVIVEGEFAAGDVLELTYAFSTDEVAGLEVPVVKPCGQYADILAPGSDAGEAAEEAGEVESDAAGDEASDATYLCEQPTDSVENEEAGH